jgi:DNA polymerase III subunit delta
MAGASKGKAAERAASTTDKDLRQLREACQQGTPPSVLVIHGDDEYRRSEIARRVPSWILSEEERDLSLTHLSGRDTGAKEILDALATEALPFFGGGRRVILVRDSALLGAKTDATGTLLASRIEAGLPSDVTLVIEATALDKRTKLASCCCSRGTVLEFAQTLREADASEFVAERFRLAGVKADRQALTALVGMVPSGTGILASEVRKLTAYVGELRHVTVEDVEAVVSRSRETAVFELTDRLGRRDVEGVLASLRELLHQGQSGLGIVMLVASRLRLLLVARALIEDGAIPNSLRNSDRYDYRWRSEWEAVSARVKERMPEDRSANLTLQHPFVVYKVLGEASQFATEELCRGLRRAAEVDVALKSTTGLSESDLVLHFVLSLCQPESLLVPSTQ